MTKEFIPYDQALIIKELGFDEPCFGIYYTKDGDIRKIDINEVGDAPLYQQAFKFFRDKYDFEGIVQKYHEGYMYITSNHKIKPYQLELVGFKTYEEAEQACLEKLIEIVKNK